MKICCTRNDVYSLLLDYPKVSFMLMVRLIVLHTFEDSLLMHFITTIDRITEEESYKFNVKENELHKAWIKYK